MRIAISHWQGRISTVFDVAQELLLVDIEDSRVVNRQQVSLAGGGPFARAREMVDLGAELLICGAISLGHEKILIQSGIPVIGFCCGDVEAALAALPKGRFGAKRFRMPGFDSQRVMINNTTTTGAGRGKKHRAGRRGHRNFKA